MFYIAKRCPHPLLNFFPFYHVCFFSGKLAKVYSVPPPTDLRNHGSICIWKILAEFKIM